jgi:hypothetical protein
MCDEGACLAKTEIFASRYDKSSDPDKRQRLSALRVVHELDMRLSMLTRPSAVSQSDESAKPPEAWVVWRTRLEIGKNYHQRPARGRPIVNAFR